MSYEKYQYRVRFALHNKQTLVRQVLRLAVHHWTYREDEVGPVKRCENNLGVSIINLQGIHYIVTHAMCRSGCESHDRNANLFPSPTYVSETVLEYSKVPTRKQTMHQLSIKVPKSVRELLHQLLTPTDDVLCCR